MRLYIGFSKRWDFYEIGTHKTSWDGEAFGVGDFIAVPKDTFETFFKTKLAPGEIRKVKSITIELEE